MELAAVDPEEPDDVVPDVDELAFFEVGDEAGEESFADFSGLVLVDGSFFPDEPSVREEEFRLSLR